MAASITATVGDASANSYVTEAEFAAYAAERSVSAAYDGASADQQVRALITATRALDVALPWNGTRTSQVQALQWPRAFCVDPDASSVDVLSAAASEFYGYFADDEIPSRVKRAQMELAYQILAGNYELDDTGLEGFTDLKVGTIGLTPNAARKAGTLPQVVLRLVQPLSRRGASGVRLVRG